MTNIELTLTTDDFSPMVKVNEICVAHFMDAEIDELNESAVIQWAQKKYNGMSDSEIRETGREFIFIILNSEFAK